MQHLRADLGRRWRGTAAVLVSLVVWAWLVGSLVPRARAEEVPKPSGPVVVGRVLDAAGRSPVPGARIGWRTDRKGGVIQLGISWDATADAEGRFRIQLEENPDSFDLGVADPGGNGESFTRYAAEDLKAGPEGTIDLGDLKLYPVRKICVVIRDESGAPVEGARALALAPAGEDSAKSDESGLAVIPSRGSVHQIVVGKPGFWPLRVSLDRLPEDPIRVTLQPENRLEIRVVNQRGEPEHNIQVVVERTDGPVFAIRASEGEGWIGVPAELSTMSFVETEPDPDTGLTFGPTGTEREVSMETSRSGAVVLRRLWPGAAMNVRVQGGGASPALRRVSLAPLGERETRTLEIQVDVPRPVTGLVVGPDGAPVRNAILDFEGGVRGEAERERARAVTDAAGRYVLPWFTAERANVRVESDPFAVRFAPDVVLPRDGSPLSFALEPSREVRVRVVDRRGQLVAGVSVGAKDKQTGHLIVYAREHDDPEARVRNLPSGEVILWAYVPGTSETVEIVHDTSDPTAEIVIGVRARLTVSVTMPPGRGIEAALLLLTPADGSQPLEYTVQEHGRRSATLDVYAPPGQYEVHLAELSFDKDARLLTERARVTLTADQPTTLELSPVPE